MIGEKVAAREGRNPRDTLSMNFLVFQVCVRDNRKDGLGANKGVITSWPYYSIYLPLLEVLSSSIGDTPTLFGCFLIILLHSQIRVYHIHLPVRHYNSLI
jgi:hypothetical protein